MSVLVATVMIIALIIGILFFIYSYYTGNLTELRASGMYVTAVVSIAIPFVVLAYGLRRYPVTEVVDAFIVIAISWLLIPALNAIIYSYIVGLSYVDALFESISGFSGTGLTIISRPEDLPYVVLMWRATTQWIGELSVVVFSGALLPHIHRIMSRVYIAERGVRFAPTILSTTRRMLAVYVVLTFMGAVMLMFSGMSFLDALAHSMTGIATGGMSTNSQNIGYWYNLYGPLILITSTVIMVLGALNFVDLYNLVRGKLTEFAKGVEVRWFIYILLLFVSITLVVSLASFGSDAGRIVAVLYHMISGLSTTGFQLGDIGSSYPDILKLVIILAMVVGGATFSTAGGIKIRRVAVLTKSIAWSLAKPFLPERAYIVRRINGETVDEDVLISVYGFVTLYIVIMLASSAALFMILNICGYSWSGKYVDALFETVSALSCVGLSAGITSISMPLAGKVLLMTIMYLGRLEFLPIYLVVGYVYRERLTL